MPLVSSSGNTDRHNLHLFRHANYSGVRIIGDIWGSEKRSNKTPVFLDPEEVGFDSVLQRAFWSKRSLGGAGALHVAPD
jgi:hypothetical protein